MCVVRASILNNLKQIQPLGYWLWVISVPVIVLVAIVVPFVWWLRDTKHAQTFDYYD